MRIQNARVFDPAVGFVQRDIGMEDGFFCANAGGEQMDAAGLYAIPGLIDMHVHGCAGHDFAAVDSPGLYAMAQYQAANGVTALCPTLPTLPPQVLAAACRQIAAHANDRGARLLGIHLEGPFLSPHKPGAQNPAHLQLPSTALFRHLQAQAQGLVKVVTLAPELPGAMQWLQEHSSELVCALGHTQADYATAKAAFAHGARQLTHLYNAMPPMLHRAPGVVGAAFDTPGCMVELICDGVHVHPSAVRAALAMFGDDRVIFVSDSIMAAGLGDGLYQLGGLPVQVQGGQARLRQNGALAGSVCNLMQCLRTAVLDMGVPLHSAVKCAASNPARALGLFARRGSIHNGKHADLLLLDDELVLRQVFVGGRPLAALA